MKRKHALKGILFILPSFAGVCIFWLFPYMDVIRRSFLGAVNGVFIGLKNYQMIFSNQAFLLAGKNTLRFFGICIPMLVILSLILAILLNGQKKKYRQLMKTAFLLPMAIPVASAAVLWKVLFNGQGLLNHFLEIIEVKRTDWLNTGASFWVLVFSYIWRNLGYDIVLWLADYLPFRKLFMKLQRWMVQIHGNVLPELPVPVFCPLYLPLWCFPC